MKHGAREVTRGNSISPTPLHRPIKSRGGDDRGGRTGDRGAIAIPFPPEGDSRVGEADDRELAEFDSEIEAEQSGQEIAGKQQVLTERMGESQSMNEAESKNHRRPPTAQVVAEQILDGDERDAQRDSDSTTCMGMDTTP